MELCYKNNPKSLFRKYAPLITSLTKHQLFRDYVIDKTLKMPQEELGLLLPNGYQTKPQRISKKLWQRKTVITPRAIYSPKLYPALYYLDKAAVFLRDLEEAENFFLGQLGLLKREEYLSDYKEIFKWFPHYAATTIARPDPNPETTTVDGFTERSVVDEIFATIRGGAGTSADDSTAGISFTRVQASTTTNQFQAIRRFVMLYDASAIPDGDNIDSATLDAKSDGIANTLGGTPAVQITTSSPASNTAIVAGDFAVANFGGTSFGSRNLADLTPAAVFTWTVNGSGLTNISKTGITKWAFRADWDVDNSFGGTWASAADARLDGQQAEAAGTTNDPTLTVTHSVPGGGFLALF